METRSFTTNSRLLNILLLCVGIFTVTSCETDEAVEQAITSNSLMTRGISISSIPTDFFYCSNDRLSPIIETLQEVESENHFTEHFQEEYYHGGLKPLCSRLAFGKFHHLQWKQMLQ